MAAATSHRQYRIPMRKIYSTPTEKHVRLRYVTRPLHIQDRQVQDNRAERFVNESGCELCSLPWMFSRLRTASPCGWAALKRRRKPSNWLAIVAPVRTSYSRNRPETRPFTKWLRMTLCACSRTEWRQILMQDRRYQNEGGPGQVKRSVL